MPDDIDVTVADNRSRHRYEACLGDKVAGFVQYREEPGRIVLVHTEVDDAFEGHGVAGRLAAGALDDARRRGLVVTPRCPFIRSYIERHPQYADLVSD